MKKTLSIFLVAAMLLCMMPVFGIFAAEADYSTIDSADEFVAFAEAVNAGTAGITGGQTITVTKDLDMTGKTYTPIKDANFSIDFGGHTISNLNVTIEEGTWQTSGNDLGNAAGMLAHKISSHNGADANVFENVTLKNCSLTVKGNAAVNVGVIGTADRGILTNVTLDNVTIKSECSGRAAALIGYTWWETSGARTVVADLKSVTIDAPAANVGALYGRVGQAASDPLIMVVEKVSGSVTVANSVNEIDTSALAFEVAANGFDTTTNAGAITLTVTDNGADGRVDTSVFKEGFLTIDDADEFVEFAKTVNKYGSAFMDGATMTVAADLDLSGKDYTPIIKLDDVTIDFGGKTVSGIDVTSSDTLAGLLITETSNVTIKNLTVKDSKLTVTGTPAQGGKVGVIVAKASNSTVDNRTVKDVTVVINGSYGDVGAVGRPEGSTVSNNTVDGLKVEVAANAAIVNVGAIAGEPADATTITDNTVNSISLAVDATGTCRNLGGLIGCTWNNTLTLTNNEVKSIEVTTGYATNGGVFIGQLNSIGTEDGNTKADALADVQDHGQEYVDGIAGESFALGTVPSADTDTDTGNDNTGDTNTGDTNKPSTDDKPAKTGDAMVVAVALAVIALAGVAVVSKKRQSAE